MALYQLRPPEPPPRRSPWLITTVLVLLVVLLGAALWVFTRGDLGLALLTTPTPSPTPGTPATATPDFRATIIAEDQATQAAYLAIVTRQTPVVQFVPVAMGGADETATAVSLNLPVVGGGVAFSPLETPTPDPNEASIILPGVQMPPPEPLVNPESPLETPTPEGPPVPGVIETETPTPTETPFETETPTMTPVPTVFLVESLRAYIAPTLTATTVWLRLAPMNTHTPVATLVAGTEIRLRGRDASGEWMYICCVDNEPRWIRQAYAPPRDNQLPPNAPAGATPNDVRWLPTQPWPGNIYQNPPATPIPSQDYPLFRRDRANTGRVPGELPEYLNQRWRAETTGEITTPALVYGSFVLVASTDRHIYGFDRTEGNQIWKYNINAVINQPPALQDNVYYFVDDQNRAAAIALGTQNPLWQTRLAVPNISDSATADTGFVVAGDALFVGVKHNDRHYIIQLDRHRGGVLRSFDIGSVASQPLVVGHQLLYVAANGLWALDIENLEQVWLRSETDFTFIRTPPLYAAEGVSALAELYVALVNGTIIALDANTGAEIRRYDAQGDTTTGLALGDSALHVSGNGFLKAWDRGSHTQLWRVNTNGEALGGAIVTSNYLIVVTTSGAIQFVNPATGIVEFGTSINAPVPQAPAVSGSYLYVPGNRLLYGFIQ